MYYFFPTIEGQWRAAGGHTPGGRAGGRYSLEINVRQGHDSDRRHGRKYELLYLRRLRQEA